MDDTDTKKTEPILIDDGQKSGETLDLTVPVVVEGGRDDLTPFDPLKRYLYEVGKFNLLTREEELELAIKVREDQDQEAAYRLVTSNLRLVVKLAMDYHRSWTKNLLDLIQEGNIGLLQAVQKYDPYKGVKFSYYASFWIKAYILKFILDNWHLVRVGTTQAQRKLFFNLRKEKERLLAQGYEPTPKLLADRLNVREKDVVEMDLRLDGWAVSLDAPVNRESGESYINFLPSDVQEADSFLANKELKYLLLDKLAEFRKTLKERDQDILDNRILSEDPATLQDLGEKYEVSRERIRQLEERIKKGVKNYLIEELPELSHSDFLSIVGSEN